jgi:hypothetical protein
MTAVGIRTALGGKREITSSMTYEEFRVACPKLAAFDKGAVTVGRFATQSPWENHPDGDELLYIVSCRSGFVTTGSGLTTAISFPSATSPS